MADAPPDGDRRARPPTRQDVARLSGVSSAVVSYVVNNGPRPVAAQTRERVLAAMRELGYRPNAVARALRLRRTNSVGLIVPDISNPYFGEFAKAIEDSAFERSYALTLVNTSNDPERETAQLASLIDRQVDGLLMISVRHYDDLAPVEAAGIPLVVVDQLDESATVPTVVIDNYGGARAGVEHLLALGHRRVAMICGPSDLPGSVSRQRGWQDALSDAGFEPHDGDRVIAPFTREGGLDAAMRLLDRSDRAHALFVSADIQAVGAVRACHALGLRIPEDVAVVSFDGTKESEFTTPALTVVRQPIELIARTAMDMLLGKDDVAKNPHRVVPFELIRRRSSGF